MQVYKALFKIIKKNISQLAIYVIVFLALSVFLANTYQAPTKVDFTETKVNMAFINYDTHSKLLEGFKGYLSNYANFIDIPDDMEKLQDALFFREVEYILRVPKGFTESLINGNQIQLEKTTVPDSTSSVYMDNLVNKYLNTAKVYINNIEELTQEQLASYIDEDLAHKTEVLMFYPNLDQARNEKRAFYFNYLAYSMLAIMILGVSTVMMVFNKTDLKRRNLCSPLKLRDMNFQLVLGNISYALIAWFIMILPSFIMYGRYMFTVNGSLLILNSFVFTLAALSISFMIGNLVKSINAMSAVTNVVSLGMCFLSGAFVPQDLLGKTVLKMASFTPTYWYIKTNNAIAKMENIKQDSIMGLLINMLIVMGFAAAFLAVSLVIIKQKRTVQSDG